MNNRFIIFCAAILALASCENKNAGCKIKDGQLSAETQIGANTMSCKIDGKVWVANGLSGHTNEVDNCKLDVFYSTSKKRNNKELLFISGTTNHRCASKNATIQVVIDTNSYEFKNKIRRYVLITDTLKEQFNIGIYSSIEPYFNTPYKANKPEHQGWVELIRNDTLTGIISGRFEFYADPTNGYGAFITGTRRHITEGRFDINYKKLPKCQTGNW